MSDYYDVLVDLCDYNAKHHLKQNPNCCQVVYTCKFDWDAPEATVDLRNVHNREIAEFASYKPDVIVGTEIVYRPLSVAMLLKSLNWLFRGRQEGSLVFILCYQKRHDYTHRLLLDGFSKN